VWVEKLWKRGEMERLEKLDVEQKRERR